MLLTPARAAGRCQRCSPVRARLGDGGAQRAAGRQASSCPWTTSRRIWCPSTWYSQRPGVPGACATAAPLLVSQAGTARERGADRAPGAQAAILDGLAQDEDDVELDQANASLTACIGKGRDIKAARPASPLRAIRHAPQGPGNRGGGGSRAAAAARGRARTRRRSLTSSPSSSGSSSPAPATRTSGPTPPHPSSRTKWTRRVPHPVLIGHAASLTPY